MINVVVDLSHHNASVYFAQLAVAGTIGVLHNLRPGGPRGMNLIFACANLQTRLLWRGCGVRLSAQPATHRPRDRAPSAVPEPRRA